MAASYKIRLSKPAVKSLKKIPLPWRERVVLVIDFLAAEPLQGDKLQGRLKGKRKLRVWPYRIIYEANTSTKIITILWIEHRKDVYK